MCLLAGLGNLVKTQVNPVGCPGDVMSIFYPSGCQSQHPSGNIQNQRSLFITPGIWLVPRWLRGKESTGQWRHRRHRRCKFNFWVRKSPWRRKWQLTLVFLSGKSHGQKSLVGYSPWDCKELDTTEHACTCARDLITPQRNGLKAFRKFCLDAWERNWHPFCV